MFIVGQSFFSETLSKLKIKAIAPLCFFHIPKKMLGVGPLGPQYSRLFARHELGWQAYLGCTYTRSFYENKPNPHFCVRLYIYLAMFQTLLFGLCIPRLIKYLTISTTLSPNTI